MINLPTEYKILIPLYSDGISNFMSVLMQKFHIEEEIKITTKITNEEFIYKIQFDIMLTNDLIEEIEKDNGHLTNVIWEINRKNISEELQDYIHTYDDKYHYTYTETNPEEKNNKNPNKTLILFVVLPKIARSLTKENLDKISNVFDWDMNSTNRNIDDNKLEKYLAGIIDSKLKNVVEFIANNTIYVDYKTLKEELLKLVDKLPNKFNVLFLNELLYPGKIGSEHWIVLILWPYIRDNVVNIISNAEYIDNDFPIIIFDDCIYSGQNIIKDINHINYVFNINKGNRELVIVEGSGLRKNEIITNKFLKNEIIIAVPYLSSVGLYRINNYKNKTNVNISAIYSKLTTPIMILMNQKLEDFALNDNLELIDFMRKHLNAMDLNIAIYFDHKIAGNSSSFPDLYEKIIKQLPSREKIEILNSLIQKEFR